MIHLSWSVKRESGRPLLPADIDRYELSVKLNGNVVPANPPAVTATSYDLNAAEPGVYAFSLVCVPKRGGKSDPATVSIELFDETKVIVFDLTVEVVSQIP